ncbi:glycosyltransferase [Anaerotruncus colihominis]|uniref:Glycosyltransferase n=1 Tax=Anaerotruncus colihominis TaxID=169435 RepID=A0A845RE21_9FIRM|nr:glycosyltransferase [Anaerotruncus colihominis]NBI77923.1 glycosyltransferase [Anaerotruncus colihominis]
MEIENNHSPPYSVLMATYCGENAAYLHRSIASILGQTVPADDFVLVCDGPLTPELDAELEYWETKTDILNLLRLPKSEGLGNALNKGLAVCKNELVARMDSDDISCPDRCQKQLRAFSMHNVEIISGIVEEFESIPGDCARWRSVPEQPEEIVRYARSRNPFNHPCVMFKKSAVESVGSYRTYMQYEDYDLWVRMFQSGMQGYNIQDTLLWMRIGNGFYRRRSGLDYFKNGFYFQRRLLRTGFISHGRFLWNIICRFIVQNLPLDLCERFYRHFLRSDDSCG